MAGNWGQWTAWSQCRSGCGGYQNRARVCDDPPPSNGGSDCAGKLSQEKRCPKCPNRRPSQGTYAIQGIKNNPSFIIEEKNNMNLFLPFNNFT